MRDVVEAQLSRSNTSLDTPRLCELISLPATVILPVKNEKLQIGAAKKVSQLERGPILNSEGPKNRFLSESLDILRPTKIFLRFASWLVVEKIHRNAISANCYGLSPSCTRHLSYDDYDAIRKLSVFENAERIYKYDRSDDFVLSIFSYVRQCIHAK